MANIYCDNYATCNGVLFDQGDDHRNETVARAKGWHIYHGHAMGGSVHDGVLCSKCADNNRRRLSPAPPLLPGQEELFSIVVEFDED